MVPGLNLTILVKAQVFEKKQKSLIWRHVHKRLSPRSVESKKMSSPFQKSCVRACTLDVICINLVDVKYGTDSRTITHSERVDIIPCL